MIECPDCCFHELAGTLSEPSPDLGIGDATAIYLCCHCRRTSRMTATQVYGSGPVEARCGRPAVVDPKRDVGVFGESPMAKAVPEMKRLREAEDAHNRKWNPGMFDGE